MLARALVVQTLAVLLLLLSMSLIRFLEPTVVVHLDDPVQILCLLYFLAVSDYYRVLILNLLSNTCPNHLKTFLFSMI